MPQAVVLNNPSPNQAKLGEPTIVRLLLNYIINANSNQIFQVGLADHLFLKASTGNDGDLKFSFDDQNQQGLLIGQVVGTSQPFKTVQVVNSTNTNITFTAVITYGVIDFKGLVIPNGVATTAVQKTAGTFAADVATGAAAKVVASPTNVRIYLFADAANTDLVYMGFDNSVTATKKIFGISSGQLIVLDAWAGDMWAFSTVAQKLSVSFF